MKKIMVLLVFILMITVSGCTNKECKVDNTNQKNLSSYKIVTRKDNEDLIVTCTDAINSYDLKTSHTFINGDIIDIEVSIASNHHYNDTHLIVRFVIGETTDGNAGFTQSLILLTFNINYLETTLILSNSIYQDSETSGEGFGLYVGNVWYLGNIYD